MTIHRSNPGDFDSTFGIEGKAELPAFVSPLIGRNLTGIALQDRKILASALAFDSKGGRHYALTRFNFDGSVDETFANQGIVVDRFVPDEHASTEALALLPDRGFALLAWSAMPSNLLAIPRLVRYDTDGNNPHTQMLDVPPGMGMLIGSGRLTSNGPHLLAALNFHAAQGAPSAMARVYQLEHDGQPATGVAKFVDILPGMGQINVAEIIQRPEGFVVSGTHSQQAMAAEGFIARYHHDGALDTSFGDGGKLFFRAKGHATQINALLRKPDGQLLVAGKVTNGEGKSQAMLMQFDHNGLPDRAFNGAEPVLDDLGMTAWHKGTIDDQQRLIAFGEGESLEYRRFLANGSTDENFSPYLGLIGITDAMTCLNQGDRTLIGFNSTALSGFLGTVMAIHN